MNYERDKHDRIMKQGIEDKRASGNGQAPSRGNARRVVRLVMLAVLIIAASCVRETPVATGRTVTVTARVGQTRAGNFGDLADGATVTTGKDFYIATLRLLVFRAGGGTLLHDYFFDLEEEDGLYFELTTGTRYDIAIIANETSDPALATTLDALPSSSTLASLDALSFASTAIDAAKPLPMTRLYRDVVVTPDGEYPDPYTPAGVAGKPAGKIAYNGGDADTDETREWEVKLTRLATRVELTLVLADQAMAERFTGVSTRRVPSKVYLFNPRAGDGTTARYNITGEAGEREATSRDIAKSAGTLADGTGEQAGKKIWTGPRLVLPACEFEDAGEEENAILLVARLSGEEGDGEHGATLGTTALGFTAPRNALFNVTGIINTTISVNVTMQNWDGVSFDTPLDGPGASPYIAVYYNGSLNLSTIENTCKEHGKEDAYISSSSFLIARPAWASNLAEFAVVMHNKFDEYHYWPTGNFSWDGGLLKLTGSFQKIEDGGPSPSGKYVIICEREP
jgi:hypothetical protein